jgi:tRNA (guanine10-N2)-dimethyltransferase
MFINLCSFYIAMKLFVLSKKCIDMSRAEVAAQYGVERVILEKGSISIVSSWSRRYERLAFTKGVYRILFACRKKDLDKEIQGHNWNGIIKKQKYKIEAPTHDETKKIATNVWKKVRKPKVDLKKPKIVLRFFFVGSTVYATILEWINPRDFINRKANKKPEYYPATLDPQLARCLVNLSGAKGTIVDPFCGIGCILIEAGFLGHHSFGIDISPWMLKKCKKNIAHYKLRKKVTMSQGNATKFYKRCSAIVTEPPFGKNTRSQNLDELYYHFLMNAKKSTRTIVMSFPHWISWKKIVKKCGWKLHQNFDWYVHKNMTRNLVVLKR